MDIYFCQIKLSSLILYPINVKSGTLPNTFEELLLSNNQSIHSEICIFGINLLKYLLRGNIYLNSHVLDCVVEIHNVDVELHFVAIPIHL